MNVTVTGASGLIGSKLVERLRARGDEVTTLSRNPSSAPARCAGCPSRSRRPRPRARRPRRRHPPRGRERRPALERRRQAPHPPLARARHPQPRGRDRGRRPAPARAHLLLRGRLLRPARRRGGRRAARRPATTSSPRSAWSGSARPSGPPTSGCASSCLRTGVVLDRGGGALAKMLPFFKLGVGGPVAGGDQYMPWIHVDDVVGLYLAALDGEAWQRPRQRHRADAGDQQDVLEGARQRAPPPRHRARARASRCARSTARWPRSSPRASA